MWMTLFIRNLKEKPLLARPDTEPTEAGAHRTAHA
jgi:hypothetical protein